MSPVSPAVPRSPVAPSDGLPSTVPPGLAARRRIQRHRRIQFMQLAQLHRRVADGPIAAVVDAAARAERIRAALRSPAVSQSRLR